VVVGHHQIVHSLSLRRFFFLRTFNCKTWVFRGIPSTVLQGAAELRERKKESKKWVLPRKRSSKGRRSKKLKNEELLRRVEASNSKNRNRKTQQQQHQHQQKLLYFSPAQK
jgi:hypothetical protein